MERQIANLYDFRQNLRVLYCGYPTSAHTQLELESERLIHARTISGTGLAHDLYTTPNRLNNSLEVVMESGAFPFNQNAFDRIIVVHFLETSPCLIQDLREIYRILQPEGQALFCLPNRLGLWAHSEQTPFGVGIPFSSLQIKKALNSIGFHVMEIRSSLHFPPTTSGLGLKFARYLEDKFHNREPGSQCDENSGDHTRQPGFKSISPEHKSSDKPVRLSLPGTGKRGPGIGKSGLSSYFGYAGIGGVLLVSAYKRQFCPLKPAGAKMKLNRLPDMAAQPQSSLDPESASLDP